MAISDRSPEAQARLDAIVDQAGPFQLFGLMVERFGARRTMELVGWAVVWDFLGVESIREMRQKYKEAGLSERAAYRAAEDYRLFSEYLLEKVGRQYELTEIISALALPRRANV